MPTGCLRACHACAAGLAGSFAVACTSHADPLPRRRPVFLSAQIIMPFTYSGEQGLSSQLSSSGGGRPCRSLSSELLPLLRLPACPGLPLDPLTHPCAPLSCSPSCCSAVAYGFIAGILSYIIINGSVYLWNLIQVRGLGRVAARGGVCEGGAGVGGRRWGVRNMQTACPFSAAVADTPIWSERLLAVHCSGNFVGRSLL